MPVRDFPFKKLTAMLLPVACLWLWVACAAICGQEVAEGSAHSLSTSSAELVEVSGAPECEGCPFVVFPKATTPERESSDTGTQTTAPAALPAHADAPMTDYSAFVQPRRPPPTAAPPLTLLSTLRI